SKRFTSGSGPSGDRWYRYPKRSRDAKERNIKRVHDDSQLHNGAETPITSLAPMRINICAGYTYIYQGGRECNAASPVCAPFVFPSVGLQSSLSGSLTLGASDFMIPM
ncbi:hypothetical protein PV325_012536, partial [Microctonus aethiopoides]